MVDLKINLLKNRPTLSESDFQKEKSLLRWAIIALITVVAIVSSFSLWSLILTSQVAGIEEALTTKSTEMQGLSEASAQQVYLKSRLKLVSDFLSDRTLTREAMQKILSTSIPGAHVAGVVFEGKTQIAVQYVSEDVASLRELLKYYESDTGYFLQVESEGISRSKDGSYQLSLLLTLPKGAQ
jgi:hypothetical protein